MLRNYEDSHGFWEPDPSTLGKPVIQSSGAAVSREKSPTAVKSTLPWVWDKWGVKAARPWSAPAPVTRTPLDSGLSALLNGWGMRQVFACEEWQYGWERVVFAEWRMTVRIWEKWDSGESGGMWASFNTGYQWNLTSSLLSSGFSQAVISQFTAFPPFMLRLARGSASDVSGVPWSAFSASAPQRRTAAGLCLRGSAPPHPRASLQRPPVATDWAPSLIACTALAPALPALNSPAIFNLWPLCLRRAGISRFASLAPLPPPLPPALLVPLSPVILPPPTSSPAHPAYSYQSQKSARPAVYAGNCSRLGDKGRVGAWEEFQLREPRSRRSGVAWPGKAPLLPARSGSGASSRACWCCERRSGSSRRKACTCGSTLTRRECL